jgi:hypothetical protein
MELRLVRSGGNINRPVAGVALSGLIILGQPFSNVGGANPDDRVVGGVVVRRPPEHFHSNYAFAKRIIPARKTVLDDVAKEILALSAGSKRNASKNILHQLFDGKSGGRGRRFKNGIVLSGHRMSRRCAPSSVHNWRYVTGEVIGHSRF